jgi:hypothetical protein
MGSDPTDRSRTENIVNSRHMFFKVFREENKKYSYVKIGSLLGYDHATVRHSIKKIEDLMQFDSKLHASYVRILTIFRDKEMVGDSLSVDHVYRKLTETNNLIKAQNDYIAKVLNENMVMRKELGLLLDVIPDSEIHRATQKIKRALRWNLNSTGTRTMK